MPPTAVGDLPMESNLHGELMIKKGNILDNPRGGNKHRFQFKVSEGYEGVVKVKVSQLATAPGDIQIFFK